MPSREEVAYFGAGPAPLPTAVLERGSQAFLNFESTGLSLAEISHRSPTAEKIIAETKQALVSLLEIPDNYDVLIMHGGGSGEFSAVVFNLVAVWVEQRRRRAMKDLHGDEDAVLERIRREVRQDLKLDYLVTGSWSLKASQEAALLLGPLGKDLVNVAVDSRKSNGGKFGSIPDQSSWNLTKSTRTGEGSAFVYYVDNETVDGVEFPCYPKRLDKGDDLIPMVVADMSSNFLSRKVDISKHAVVFGGAQKNIGITDITFVIVHQGILDVVPAPSFLHAVGVWSPPTIFSWPVVAKNNSLFNTMPIFSIWIAGEVMRDLLKTHGARKLEGQEELSNTKARILYEVLDAYENREVYQVVPEKSVRSRMNICFRIRHGDAAAEKQFLEGAEVRMLQGLKGHRSVGGIRISNYNAVPLANVDKIRRYIEEFAKPSVKPG